MFRGRFEHAIDVKCRLSIPALFREVLSTHYDERLVITNFNGALWAYPVAEWERFEERVAALPQFKKEVMALQRVFISGATECPIDSSGRILLPPTLREYAAIERDVIVVGTLRRIEIWARERWEKIFENAQSALEEMGETLADLGL
ncbi:MAG: division/cell wall cluster transcriptional repressor MraZ [Deltaproteobacteria bacterium]|nr:division/cell wall cluster transcriptional repressor MraZ [Deltaproteobacteria bacterium]